jgi:hypothetical protein
MTEYNYDENLISDLHKDARGYRPREGFWSEWANLSDAGRQDVWDGLLREFDRAYEEQKDAEQRHLEKFRETLRKVMTSQAVDWHTALRWLMQADGEQDLEHFLWKQGVSWSKNREIQTLYEQREAA